MKLGPHALVIKFQLNLAYFWGTVSVQDTYGFETTVCHHLWFGSWIRLVLVRVQHHPECGHQEPVLCVVKTELDVGSHGIQQLPCDKILVPART